MFEGHHSPARLLMKKTPQQVHHLAYLSPLATRNILTTRDQDKKDRSQDER